MNFKKEVQRLADVWEGVEKYEIDISSDIMPSLDFFKSRQNLYLQNLNACILGIQKSVETLQLDNPEQLVKITELVRKLETKEKEEMKAVINELKAISEQLNIKEEDKIELPLNVPADIFSELEADVNELSKCFYSGCYRSTAILCGRILEVVLHRKYFELTNNDLLEKSPGIGLGNIIAKMNEKGIKLDPGLDHQIHLINQVRIFSVHKKQTPFYPSRAQAEAMILYTMDIVQKIFS